MEDPTNESGIRSDKNTSTDSSPHAEVTEATASERRDAVAAGLASWQVEPCPTWCENQHSDQDWLEDRDHGRQVAEIPMRLANPVNFGNEDDPAWLPPLWHVSLRQPEGGGRVTIHMYSDDVSPMIVVDLRPDDASELASALVEAIGSAR